MGEVSRMKKETDEYLTFRIQYREVPDIEVTDLYTSQ